MWKLAKSQRDILSISMLVIISLLTACSNNKPRIESKTYNNTVWPTVSTFAMSPDSKLANEKLAGINTAEVRQKIEASIREELKSRNIQEVSETEQADIVVTYLGASVMRVGMQKEGQVYGDSATIGSATHTDVGFDGRSMVDFNEGALVIVVSDPKSGDDLWQGRALTNIKVDAGKHKRDLIISESVGKIFEKFPKQ